MKADIVCVVCEAILGTITKQVINDYDVNRYQNCFTCDCGGECSLVIQPEE